MSSTELRLARTVLDRITEEADAVGELTEGDVASTGEVWNRITGRAADAGGPNDQAAMTTVESFGGVVSHLRDQESPALTAVEWSAVAVDDLAWIAGRRLVAYLLGIENTDDLDEFDLVTLRSDARKRLCTARWLATQVAAEFDSLTAQSWLVARNPTLGHQTPLQALRDADRFEDVAPYLANAVTHLFS